ncbi:hypothetical protein BLS_009007 [Venturia inaequalis]|uniref:Uncharacterized protein n=1 Tax=Venturia inaequalis TaxID=5025 RepID=A0A8H3VQX0_VENIN|nr:hypothetical protein EG328_010184 [Venturia inaequalis]KAE9985264.1 hypothetical protein BLS_009007 [Venturia inaequalis]KAE9991353.1 hypothetical protein EG327_011794 [Venturia inaequalis]RDI88441.1 hypothetical protein Vi05172_g1101 [Venturia inaequalis]
MGFDSMSKTMRAKEMPQVDEQTPPQTPPAQLQQSIAQMQQQSSSPIETQLTGVGQVSRKPDCAVLVFEIAHRDFKEKGANPSVLEAVRNDVLRDALATVQIFCKWREDYNEDQITHFSISELGANSRIQSDQRIFEAKTMVKITFAAVGNFESLRKFAKEAIRENGVTITNIDWRLSDGNREAVHRDARTKAILNARQIALQHATELYDLQYTFDEIKPSWSDERPYYTYTAIDCCRSAASASEGKVVHFVPEDIQVTVNVSCKFQLDLGKARAAAPTANGGSPNAGLKIIDVAELSPDEAITPVAKKQRNTRGRVKVSGNGR